jgi:hypothetical protein
MLPVDPSIEIVFIYIYSKALNIKYKIGIVGQKLSILSKNPPCPGIKLLLSFIFAIRFKNDSYISPNKLREVTKTASNMPSNTFKNP